MQTTRTTRRLSLALAALIGAGAVFAGPVTSASADIGDLTSCVDPTHGGSLCDNGGDDTPFDGPDDFAPGGNGPEDPELPEGQPEADDGELPPADVDGTVVADPTFTG